ncbi:uncharacterized protein BO88DRAFT_52232 [Aspergillus vadensis CBS 113365]|uniref:Uncharacterized protein n=1 Tax=Aspergillus vadensis (strain CBS 113365 / IMI 142717 / IBT 24658) TaxID=1448311 RepID=A0A319B7X1_ASPVC|nr:hypothetical protein BO88DRAFT_52232 [Aspergillus vadensis CBS 113365]PYH68817.1 hypothetical protein BO88DRAFT_52232 [Aspergillus vadensis CBS 113365]
MTQSNNHHRRTSSGSNVPKLRNSRPALHRRGTSFVNHSISKLGSGQVTKQLELDDDRQPEMAASFLNFCAMCEKQITVPDNSLLYCSERYETPYRATALTCTASTVGLNSNQFPLALPLSQCYLFPFNNFLLTHYLCSCRRKDSHKPLSASFSSNSSMSSSTTPPASPPMSPRMIVAPMTPTKGAARSSISRIPSEWNDSKTDQDPSEWKPVIPMGSGASSLASSEAWNYLSQFHRDDTMMPVRRPRFDHRSSTSLSALWSATGSVPPLMHTPSTAASSVSSNGSDYMSYMHDSAYRPLPPRHKPQMSGCSSASKGLDLVVPHVHVSVEDAPAVNISNDGSIFPASSALWDEKPIEKTPTLKTALGSPTSDISARSLEEIS